MFFFSLIMDDQVFLGVVFCYFYFFTLFFLFIKMPRESLSLYLESMVLLIVNGKLTAISCLSPVIQMEQGEG